MMLRDSDMLHVVFEIDFLRIFLVPDLKKIAIICWELEG